MFHAQPRQTRGEDTGWRLTVGRRAAFGVALLTTGAVAALAPGAQAATTTYTVTGTVNLPASAPLTADASDVRAELIQGGAQYGSTVGVVDSSTATPNSAGHVSTGSYTFTGVPTGNYKLLLVDYDSSDNVGPLYYGGGTAYAAAQTITVSGATTLNATTLPTGSTIIGTFTDANMTATSGETASVSACPYTVGSSDPMLSDGDFCEYGTVTKGTNSYVIGGLIAGQRYYLTVGESVPDGTLGTTYSGGGYVDGTGVTAEQSLSTPFTAPATASFAIPQLGEIVATVTDPSGGPLSGGNLSLLTVDGQTIYYGDFDPSSTNTSTTPAGTQTLYGVWPGSYKLQYSPSSPMYLTTVYSGNSATLAGASTLTVAAGQTVTTGLQSGLAGTISGTVTAAQGGATLGDLLVEAVDSNGAAVASTSTNPDGTYLLTGVPAGTWHIEVVGGLAASNVYYQTEFYGSTNVLAGSKTVTLTAGQNLTGINQAALAQSLTLPGIATFSHLKVSGEYKNKTTLSFAVAAGSGVAPYLDAVAVRLPKGLTWAPRKVAADVIVTGATAPTVTASGRMLYVTVPTGTAGVSVKVKAGAITATKAVRKATKSRKLKTQTFTVTATDTLGNVTGLSLTVKKPH